MIKKGSLGFRLGKWVAIALMVALTSCSPKTTSVKYYPKKRTSSQKEQRVFITTFIIGYALMLHFINEDKQ